MTIYSITNKINGKKYVGKTTKDVNKYWDAKYRNKSVLNTQPKRAIKRAFKKYGINSFLFEVIDTASSLKQLNEKEKLWIQKCNSFGRNGYNMTLGGDGGDTLSTHPQKDDIYKRSSATFRKLKRGWTEKHVPEYVKRKISKTLTGRKLPENVRHNISESLKGRVFSSETIEKLRIINTGEGNPMFGKIPWNSGLNKETSVIIKETSKKLSDIFKKQFENGRKPWNYGKKMGAMSIENKEKRCKTWCITYPNGNTKTLKLLKKWCLENDIKYKQFLKHRGYNGFILKEV